MLALHTHDPFTVFRLDLKMPDALLLEKWRVSLHLLEHCSIFHTPAWLQLIARHTTDSVIVLIALDKETLVGIMPLVVRSMPGGIKSIASPDNYLGETVYGGPIALPGRGDVLRLLLDVALNVASGCAWWEIQPPPHFDSTPLIESGYRVRSIFSTPIINLQHGKDEVLRGMNGKSRNLVRKALKQRLTLEVLSDARQVDNYYPLILATMARSGKTALAYEFYADLLDTLGPLDMARLFLAKYEGATVAAGIFLFFSDIVYYWSGAAIDQYSHMVPNYFVQWQLIEFALGWNCKSYDMLRVTPDLPGITMFKTKFGGTLIPLHYAVKRSLLGKMIRVGQAVAQPRWTLDKILTRAKHAQPEDSS